MKHAVVILAIILTATTTFQAGQQGRKRKPGRPGTTAAPSGNAWADMKGRFTKHADFLSGNIWTLIHAYRSKSEMERSLKLFESISIALASDDPASMKKFDGPGGFKEQFLRSMSSRDDTVSGFAAIVLAIIGDLKYAPQIAALLTRNSHLPPDKYPPITVRGRAALALGMLGTKQYIPQIANLLRSKNEYDRSGAAMALGYLHATEHAKAVADLLTLDDVGSSDDTSPIHSLFEMGMAANYKKEIARVIDDEIPGDKAVTASYALARLGAKEHAIDIAKLLNNDYRRRDAAKALALLRAREYISKILVGLEDQDSFNREGAALALGIFGAKEHASAVAKLLKDKEPWVQRAAALSLVLLEANDYIKEALPIVALQKEGPYFDSADFNPLVDEEVRRLDNRFRVLLAWMKAHKAGP